MGQNNKRLSQHQGKNIKRKNSLVFSLFFILVYSILNIIVLLHHEPWGDEAHTWLVARDLNIISIFRQMAYDGTPALWYMILVPFAKTGLPYMSEFILHLIIVIAAVTIFVLYAPFSKLTKVLFIFSYYMAYEYSIIARSYSLSILLLFIIAALYNRRFEHPLWYSLLSFLLFNTNAHGFFIASALTILFAWEFYRNKAQHGTIGNISIFIMVLGGLLSILQLLPHPDSIDYENIYGVVYLAPFVAIANAFFPWHTAFSIPGEICIVLMVISFFMFCTIILSLYKKPAILFILLLSFSGLFYVFTFKYPGALRHHGFVLIMLLFAVWISKYYPDPQNNSFSIPPNNNLLNISVAMINFCLLLSLLYSINIQYLEYKYIFSGAKKMADFINRNYRDNYTIIAHQSTDASAILPYLPKKRFWYADIEDYGTFVRYNKQYLTGRAISNVQIISRIGKEFPDKSQILLLLTSPLDFPESYCFKLFYKVDKDIFGYGKEKFYLYTPINQKPCDRGHKE